MAALEARGSVAAKLEAPAAGDGGGDAGTRARESFGRGSAALAERRDRADSGPGAAPRPSRSASDRERHPRACRNGRPW